MIFGKQNEERMGVWEYGGMGMEFMGMKVCVILQR